MVAKLLSRGCFWRLMLATLVGTFSYGEMYRRFPHGTSVHFFTGVTFGIVSWTVLAWSATVISWVRYPRSSDYVKIQVDMEQSGAMQLGPKRLYRSDKIQRLSIPLMCTTGLVLYWMWLGFSPMTSSPPPRYRQKLNLHNSTINEKIFIAANLYNVAEIGDTWSSQVIALSEVCECDLAWTNPSVISRRLTFLHDSGRRERLCLHLRIQFCRHYAVPSCKLRE